MRQSLSFQNGRIRLVLDETRSGKETSRVRFYNDNLEEVFENREQIEISRYYEKLPKSTLIAAQEYEDGKVYYKNPAKEKNNF